MGLYRRIALRTYRKGYLGIDGRQLPSAKHVFIDVRQVTV
jgi:hypothetical protein